MPRKFHKNTKMQTPKALAKQPREMFRHSIDIFTKQSHQKGMDIWDSCFVCSAKKIDTFISFSCFWILIVSLERFVSDT